jgi:hypothetical protein
MCFMYRFFSYFSCLLDDLMRQKVEDSLEWLEEKDYLDGNDNEKWRFIIENNSNIWSKTKQRKSF